MIYILKIIREIFIKIEFINRLIFIKEIENVFKKFLCRKVLDLNGFIGKFCEILKYVNFKGV